MFLKRLIDVNAVFFRNYGFAVMEVAAFFAFDLLYHQKRRLNLWTYFYALAALASAYSMVLSPFFPDRFFLIVFVFAGITLGSVVMQFEMQIIKRNIPCIVIVLLLVLSFSVLKAGKNIVGIYLKWQNRIEYITAQRDMGNLDVEVKAPIPATDRHAALYEIVDIVDNPDEWSNVSIAEYFGLRSIRRTR